MATATPEPGDGGRTQSGSETEAPAGAASPSNRITLSDLSDALWLALPVLRVAERHAQGRGAAPDGGRVREMCLLAAAVLAGPLAACDGEPMDGPAADLATRLHDVLEDAGQVLMRLALAVAGQSAWPSAGELGRAVRHVQDGILETRDVPWGSHIRLALERPTDVQRTQQAMGGPAA